MSVRVQFMKEQLTFNGDDTAIATLMLSVMGAFAEFERALIKERQREGIALAKQRGAYRGRRKASPPIRLTGCEPALGLVNRKPPWPESSASAARPSTNISAPIPEPGSTRTAFHCGW